MSRFKMFAEGSEILQRVRNRGGERYYYHRDEQGSIVQLTDADGNVKNQYIYDAFGVILDKEEQVTNRITYVGQQYDGTTGQYYLRARYYNPVVGRFMQEDTYRGDGLDLYAYCRNNPVTYFDFSGYEGQPQNGQGNEETSGEGGTKTPYIPRDADGNPIPLSKQTVNGQDIPLPDPAAKGYPHTTLGGKISSKTGEVYLQSATFPEGTWPKVKGQDVPWSEVHWTNHGRGDHLNPHQHIFTYNPDKGGWVRGGPSYYDGK